MIMCIALQSIALPSRADSELQDRQSEFLNSVFSSEIPSTRTLWLKDELRKDVARILRHEPRFLRARYWYKESVSVWVLEEIGKTQPITFAISIIDNQIDRFEVLAFRESRGWEIKYDFFTRQFLGAGISSDASLNTNIDGVTGATLSVRASEKVAQIALIFARHISEKEEG
jgi:hypothetical protein